MLKFIIILLAGLLFLGFAYEQFDLTFGEDEEKTEAVACTMDAMQCPDGSYVGRSGPDCEFVCPE